MAKMLKLRKKEVPYTELEVPLGQLAFYPENPRIYSQFAGSGDRTQENIQAKLEGMDHVKELRSQIDRDGQVNEPLFCMPVLPGSELDGLYEFQVLEGNSRLGRAADEQERAHCRRSARGHAMFSTSRPTASRKPKA